MSKSNQNKTVVDANMPKVLLEPIAICCPFCVSATSWSEALEANKKEKLKILRAYLKKKYDARTDEQLLLALATLYVPGFKVEFVKVPGRRRVFDSPMGQLFYEFVQLYLQQTKSSEAAAVRAVYAKHHGNFTMPADLDDKTLQRRYREIKTRIRSGASQYVTESVSDSGGVIAYKSGSGCTHYEILEHLFDRAERENYPIDKLFDQLRKKS